MPIVFNLTQQQFTYKFLLLSKLKHTVLVDNIILLIFTA